MKFAEICTVNEKILVFVTLRVIKDLKMPVVYCLTIFKFKKNVDCMHALVY